MKTIIAVITVAYSALGWCPPIWNEGGRAADARWQPNPVIRFSQSKYTPPTTTAGTVRPLGSGQIVSHAPSGSLAAPNPKASALVVGGDIVNAETK